ncbi:MAG: hypothetical protein ABIX36_11295 [Mucilaginibacter sp.]|uniref:hypothetical protein n=1 Tax=Mucilaginibacter sp. TaxID=1882438 RepID=UPI00326457CC
MYDKKKIIGEMSRTNWNPDSNKEKEQFLLQILRGTNDIEEISELCEALGSKGSLFAIPTLMARMIDAEIEEKSWFLGALMMLRLRMAGWDIQMLDKLFEPEWWQTKWIGSKGRFLSFISLLSADQSNYFDSLKMEELAQAVIKEMKFDISPYNTFNELKICTPEWNLEQDLTIMLAGVEEDLLMAPIFKDKILKNLDSQVAENIINMRNDYLVTRLNLHHNFQHYHYLLKTISVLNRP